MMLELQQAEYRLGHMHLQAPACRHTPGTPSRLVLEQSRSLLGTEPSGHNRGSDWSAILEACLWLDRTAVERWANQADLLSLASVDSLRARGI